MLSLCRFFLSFVNSSTVILQAFIRVPSVVCKGFRKGALYGNIAAWIHNI